MTNPNASAQVDDSKAGPSQADLLVNLCRLHLLLFHDEGGTLYGVGSVNGHTEIMPMRTRAFRDYLANLYYVQHNKVPGSAAVEAAISVLCGQAAKGREIPVYLRIGYQGGNLYVDLCNQARQVVEITPAGWKVLDDSPVYFKRRKGMSALPLPQTGGDIDELLPFLNLGTPDNQILVIAWILSAFSQGPFPILVNVGEQGSGKSTNGRIFKALIDPNEADIRSKPRDEQDLQIAANNSHLLVYDNLSSLSDWLSDAFCRLSTGGGWSTRELWTNDDESIFYAKRPLVINGIADLVNRGDLMSRSIVINLPSMNESTRRPEKEFWAEFEKAKPRITGALYTILAGTLANLPGVKLTAAPRMADFAEFIIAAEPMLRWSEGTFLSAYQANIEDSTAVVLEDSIVGSEVQALVMNKSWEGTAAELLRELASLNYATPRYDYFSKLKETQLSGELRRVAPSLRAFGIDVEFVRTRKRGKFERLIQITNLSMVSNSVRTVHP